RDPDLGKVVLYQLSYFRIKSMFVFCFCDAKLWLFTETAKCFCDFFASFFHFIFKPADSQKQTEATFFDDFFRVSG
ncbi:MAG: hypothetical protein ACI4AX_03930, partial [Muribaculaceae bacterium]